MRKRALLIGINNYNSLQPVGYAKNDAESVAKVLLNSYNFKRDEIVLLTDRFQGDFAPLQNNIKHQILALRQIESLDFLLFGFWGHGVIDDQLKRYLCVQDTSTDGGCLQRTAFSLEAVLNVLKQIAVPQTCVLLDCCQNIAAIQGETPATLTENDCNLFRQGARNIVAASESKQQANPTANPVIPTTIIMNSCSATQQSHEWSERQHGIFTAHLLEAMTATPSVSQWAQHVYKQVPLTATNFNHHQVPYISMEGGTDIQIPGFQKAAPISKSNPGMVISEDPNQVQIRDYKVGEIQINFEKMVWPQEPTPTSERVALPAVPVELRELQGELAGLEKLLEEIRTETASALKPAKISIELARQQRNQIAKRQSDFLTKINPSDEDRRQLETVINDQMNIAVPPVSLGYGKPESMSMPNFVRLVFWQQKKIQAETIVRRMEDEYNKKLTEIFVYFNQQKENKQVSYQMATTAFYEQVIDLVLSVCFGYDMMEAPVPNEELVYLLPLLEQYHLGWSDVEIWNMATKRWSENRPCVIKEQERHRQTKVGNLKSLAIKCITAATILLAILSVVVFVFMSNKSTLVVKESVTSEDDSIPQAGAQKIVTINGIKCVFKWCPPGTYMMGSPKGEPGRNKAEKQREITLTKGFWLLEHEVTQKMWQSVMGNNPSYFKDNDLPVEQVSWNDCKEFIAKLNGVFESSLQFRLPMETEWEYACRAGTTGAYAGNLDDMGWYKDNSGVCTHEIKTKNPNVWGLYDMYGNVSEWCEDWFGDTPDGSVTDPSTPNSNSNQFIRGGGWFHKAEYCRSAHFLYGKPELRDEGLGFRLVLSTTSPAESVSTVLVSDTPEEDSTPKAGEQVSMTIAGVQYVFRLCLPGKFMMGNPEDKTQHEVTLTKGFALLEHEVTQAMWQSVMGNNPSYFKGNNFPVTMVSWNECQVFIGKLNGLVDPSIRFRLPTEAEWEYACRAGTTGAYAGTGNLENMGWYGINSGNRTHLVKTKKPNAWGLYDMHGNVREWCEDLYDVYPSGSITDPSGPNGGTHRIFRGGSWNHNAKNCRSASRDWYLPDFRDGNLGFRLVLSLAP